MKNKNQLNMFGADSIANENSLFFGIPTAAPEKEAEANKHQDKIQEIYDIFADGEDHQQNLAAKYGTTVEVVEAAQKAFYGGDGSDLVSAAYPNGCTLKEAIEHFVDRSFAGFDDQIEGAK